jgi:hypothetical protein
MKFITAVLAWLGLLLMPLQAQQENINWALSVQPNGMGNYTLIMKAKVNKGWHLYSQTNPPNKTVFQVSLGNQKPSDMLFSEPKPKKVNDEYLGPTAFFEEHAVTFKKDLDLCALPPNSKIQVSVMGQICTETDGMCLPFRPRPFGDYCDDNDPSTVRTCLPSPASSLPLALALIRSFSA